MISARLDTLSAELSTARPWHGMTRSNRQGVEMIAFSLAVLVSSVVLGALVSSILRAFRGFEQQADTTNERKETGVR